MDMDGLKQMKQRHGHGVGPTLTIRITSFSFMKGIPDDPTDNGGGFVFDCRGLPNPGKETRFRTLSGLDQPVIDFFEQFPVPVVEQFLAHVRRLLAISIDNYIQRGFTHLCINFGCTGGQHRSVYLAEKIHEWIEATYPVERVLVHREKDNWEKP
jgi:RNase adaptor protein for sRNA GlmZ degradation